MRLPYENYIRFLITNGLDSSETNEELSKLQLPKISVDYWDSQFEIMHSTKLPKQIYKFWKNNSKKIPQNFLNFMASVGLKEAWQYNMGNSKSFTIAMDALLDEDICLIINALLIRKAESDEISAIINGKFGMNLPKQAIEIFKDYFFNVTIMSREAWRAYLSLLDQESKSILHKALTGREIELRASLGLPNKISVAEHYQKLHIMALDKFSRLSNSSTADSDNQALKWAKIMMESGDRYEKMKLGDATDFGKDLQMEFDYIDTDFPTIGVEEMSQVTASKESGEKAENSEPIPLKSEDES